MGCGNVKTFSLPPSSQSITYGPLTSTEFVVRNWTWFGHTVVSFVTAPGVGVGNSIVLTVADQVGPVSAPLLDYASPTIVSVSPPQSGTFSDPKSPVTVNVSGSDFGLSNPNVGVVVGFGNPGDGTFVELDITGRSPALATVSQAGYSPTPGQAESVTFNLPESVGSNRTVRIVPFLLAQGKPTTPIVLATPSSALFTYFPPVISSAATDPVPSGSEAQADCAAAGVCTGTTILSAVRRLQIFGANFGPSQLASGDTVGRTIEFSNNVDGPWDASSVSFAPANWSHGLVEAFTLQPGGYIRVTLSLSSPSGAAYTLSSNAICYKDYSPTISAIQGTLSGIPTTGGVDPIMIFAQNLDSTQYTLNVTVGGINAVLLNSSGAVIDPSQAKAQIVGTGSHPQNYTWTIYALIPPGQGLGQGINLVRDGVPSGLSGSVDYAAPSLTGWASCSGSPGNWICGPTQPLLFSTLTTALTSGGRIRESDNVLCQDCCPSPPSPTIPLSHPC